MNADEFDALFDSGEEVIGYLDLSRATHPNREKAAQQRLNVDVPSWIVKSLDLEANRIGVTRQSLIKMWMVEKLDSLPSHPHP